MIRLPLLLSLTLLSACAAAVVPIPVPTPPPPEKPSLQLIGRDPAEVAALLGKPALDRSEGTARQLQFANASCVLDIFFYPDRKSGKVAATYLEARTRAGQAFETRACVDALAARS
jgi:hypothetical protein